MVNCLVQISLLVNCFVTFSLQQCYNGRYDPEGYAELLVSDYNKVVPQLSHCLSLCSVNQTCAAMSYDGETSTCFMSSVPTFLNKPDVEPNALLKVAHKVNLTVIQFRTDLTEGGHAQSSTSPNSGKNPGFAIDGRYIHNLGGLSEWYYLFSTAFEQQPWISITLTTTYWIAGVKLWNSYLYPDQIINNAQVHVADKDEECGTFPEETRCGEWPGKPWSNPVYFECAKSMLGKCVKITGRDQVLSIHEVEVHGWNTF